VFPAPYKPPTWGIDTPDKGLATPLGGVSRGLGRGVKGSGGDHYNDPHIYNIYNNR